MAQPHFIVFANEKGGTGKSTTAVHTAVALAASGHRVGALDLDARQRTMTRYLENRDATMRRLETDLPKAPTKCSRTIAKRASPPRSSGCRPTPTSSSSIRPAATTRCRAPRSCGRHSGHADERQLRRPRPYRPGPPGKLQVTRPSFYAELIWNSRTERAKTTGKSVDWVVLRNRLQHVDSHNLKRVGAALDELARRVASGSSPALASA